ncbi:MAG: UDP-3-O-(3-hydroxymyristoyl)glucosamine N-acyltransferase [Vicinamibacterales bacterium]
MTLSELADRLSCRLDGDGSLEITGVAGIQDAGPGELTFVANPKYLSLLAGTRASAVVLREDAPAAPCAMLRTADPYLAFARAVGVFAPVSRPAPGVHPLACVDAGAVLGPDVSIGPFAVVGAGAVVGARTVVYPHVTIGPDARLGDDCVIHARVSIRERVVVGHRVVLQDGVVLGGDGYGFVRRSDGTHEKIPQVAGVTIEDDVEIGANTTVDRPAVGETRIRAGAKIDNLVQIGHGVSVGRNVLMAAQVGVAGSTRIEDDVIFGGQVGVGGHLVIGRGSVAVGQAGVTNSLEPGQMVAGYPAIASREWRRSSAVFRRLPELKKRIEALEAEIARLTAAAEKRGDPE